VVDTLASSINYQNRPALQLAYLDITERKQAEEELRVSRDRFKTIFARAGMGIVVANIMGCIEDCNGAFSEILGYDNEELLKKHFKDITFSEDIDKNLDLFRQMIAGKTDRYEMEKRYKSKDGRQIWCNLTASAIRGDNGELLQILALVDDISERKEAEESIATSNRKVAEILESIQDGFFTVDRNWCFTYANMRAAANLGLKPENLIGQNLWEMFPVIKGTAHEIAYRKSMEDRVVQRFETKGALTDRWYDISVYPSAEGISVYWQDITERKQAEESLRETKDYLENLINYANAPIIVWDTSFNITRFNQAFEQLTGLLARDVLGNPLEMLFPGDGKDESLELIRRTTTGERLDAVEIPILRTDKSVRIVLWNSANIYDKDGTAVVATIAQDRILPIVSERNSSCEQLWRASGMASSPVMETGDLFMSTPQLRAFWVSAARKCSAGATGKYFLSRSALTWSANTALLRQGKSGTSRISMSRGPLVPQPMLPA